MLLTGVEISSGAAKGTITIEPFNRENIGPNSYDVTLSDQLLVYESSVLDMRKENKARLVTIPPEGVVLAPGNIYLGSTVEVIGSSQYVPCLEGRSSVGRLGLEIHRTAGVGDRGFVGNWTLEMSVIQPLRIYAGVRIGQILFWDISPWASLSYAGKYVGQRGPQASRMHLDREFQP